MKRRDTQEIEKSPEVTPMTMSDVQRLGDIKKCPACGSEVDPGAYHCPTCRNYFCFRCRARVLASEAQLQCINQDCDYHGKLVCATCDPVVKKEEPPAVYTEYEGGWWTHVLLGSLAVFVVALFFTRLLGATGCAVVAFVGGAILLHRAGVNVFGKRTQIVEPRASFNHSCIRCKVPVKDLR